MKHIAQKFQGLCKSYKAETNGQFSIMVAVSAFAILAGLATAVDISNSMSERQRLQDKTDAIALMAVRQNLQSQEDLNALANTYLQTSYGADLGTVVLNSITRQGDVVTVDATNNVKTYLSGVFNTEVLNVRVNSTATYTERAAEIALVLDSTGSMSGQKMATLKNAAGSLIDTLADTKNSRLRLSVVPFAQYVNVGTANLSEPWIEPSANINAPTWEGCIGSRQGSNDEKATFDSTPFPAVGNQLGSGGQVSCGVSVLPLTTNYSAVKSKVQSMVAAGWTYMPAGLAWGWRTLTPDLPFDQGLPFDGSSDKIIILMSDGTNTRAKSGALHNSNSRHAADTKTTRLCEGIKGDDIRVITIAYEITDSSTVNLIRDCASKQTDFFDAQNSNDLLNAFDSIARSLSSLRISS